MAPKRKLQFNCDIESPNSNSVRLPDSQDPDDASRDLNENLDEVNTVLVRNIQKFDISAFPYELGPGLFDLATGLFEKNDFTALALKPDHQARPLRVDGCARLVLEKFHPLVSQVQEFLVTIAEQISRPDFLHEYRLTTHSLYAAVSVGLTADDIIKTLARFSKNEMPQNVIRYIQHCGRRYGMVKLVLRNGKYYLETVDLATLQMLLQDTRIRHCRVQDQAATHKVFKPIGAPVAGTKAAERVREAEGLSGARTIVDDMQDSNAATIHHTLHNEEEDDEDQRVVHSFQIADDKVGAVAERCLALHHPALEEYDFKNDHANANLEIDLRPGT
ncbi:helicase conserved C-terminal domain-containing protein [Stachybotrys elegans]|uniref:Helicase conserved C-terminal domain-containing protein n=1 Tax=Stachybotrys elegans TaxID=80388 RepID=A0A8K0WTV5_9HYPO|nr:helicase conserved C-terminal domain-containing protein [Stachybotrys elegans]